MCKLFLAFALSYHMSTSPQNLNSYHPNSGIECSEYEAGVFYNSEKKLSIYGEYKLDISPKSYLGIGLASGYEGFVILPYMRYVNRIFFVSPGVFQYVKTRTLEEQIITVDNSIHFVLLLGVNIKLRF